MPESTPIRVDQDVYASAEAVASATSRSASQQISFWARIGRAVDQSPFSSRRSIEQVLGGDRGYDALNLLEQAVFRSRRDERSQERLRTLDLESVFAAEGRSYVELDDEGSVAERSAPSRA